MERFGFSPGFIAMTRVLHCDIESLLKFNGVPGNSAFPLLRITSLFLSVKGYMLFSLFW